MKKNLARIAAVAVTLVALTALAAPQLKQAIKILGVGAAVKQFGPQINKEFNKLTNHTDTSRSFTKVVPIITVGVHARGAIGAAQIMGAKVNVQKVQAVASPEVSMFGEINLRALIPIDSLKVTDPKKIKAVDGVGVSGIVDLRL
ncbi:MAG TPA: hypothetical protein VNI20_09680 [Fimbriimonadaceae bacterium]|nr:hypothetical protein [Fimbriimonadaceae bacterium]